MKIGWWITGHLAAYHSPFTIHRLPFAIFRTGHMTTDTDTHENFTTKYTKSAKDFLRLFFALFAPLW